jgi:hypothetical protein
MLLELEVLTKYVTVMLLIVLAEAALRWNFIFWSYFVVIFRVGVDVLIWIFRYSNQKIITFNTISFLVSTCVYLTN